MWLFILRANNDIDHITPIIWKSQTTGHPCMVVFMDLNDNIDIHKDSRLRHLTKCGVLVYYYYAIPSGFHLKNQPLINPYNPIKVKIFRILRKLLQNRLFGFGWAVKVIEKYEIKVICVDPHTPNPKDPNDNLLFACKFLGVPSVMLGHGPNVYSSIYTEEIMKQMEDGRLKYEKHIESYLESLNAISR